jgi:hypothetical protein
VGGTGEGGKRVKTTEKKKGWTRQFPIGTEDCHPGQMGTDLWNLIHTVDIDTAEQRAERAALYCEWLTDAEIAEQNGDLHNLKRIADLVRDEVGELPAGTPKYFYPEKLKYKDSLTLEQIRARLMADIHSRKLGGLFQIARDFEKGGTVQ